MASCNSTWRPAVLGSRRKNAVSRMPGPATVRSSITPKVYTSRMYKERTGDFQSQTVRSPREPPGWEHDTELNVRVRSG